MSDSGQALLRVENVTHRFGGLVAVRDCNWSVTPGSLVALIGPNGAGKSTIANLIAGSLRVQQGRIVFNGRDISGWPAYRVAQAGLIRVFQISRDFDNLTLFENMLVAAARQPGESLLDAVLRRSLIRQAETRNLRRAAQLLGDFELYQLRNSYASEISGGQKRLLQLARALMAEPRMLLLDEPMAGISPVLIERIVGHLRRIRDSGVTVVLIEHNLNVVELICDEVTVMVDGTPIARGTMQEVRAHHQVLDAYLGREVSGLAPD
jgi:ABC-type branched-subunit amino acid transport system ATPase component